MPFNSKTASAAGKTGGRKSAAKRWNEKNTTVRDKQIKLTVTHDELAMMNVKAATAGISRTELIVRAVKEFKTG